MTAKHRILKTALTLGQSTVKDIANELSMSEVTVRSALTSYKNFFAVTKTDKGVRGGQVQLWEIRPERIDDVKEEILRGESPGRSGPKVRNPSSTPELVTAEDLVHYDPLPSSTLILSLVRKILTSLGVAHLELPGGEGIRVPGYDGRVTSVASAINVPLGESVWEFGVGKNPRDKANNDFRKRAKSPGDIDPASTTFVMVLSHRLTNKHSWENDRRAEGIWKDVQVRDADDIVTWFEANPSIHIWLSQEMGLHPSDVVTLESWYDTWLRQTIPPLPPTLLLAGRETEVNTLCDRVATPGQLIAVYGRSWEESRSFAAAALRQVSDTELLRPYLPLLVKTEQEWSRLTGSMSSGILVPDFLNADVASATERGLTVVLPLGPGDRKSKDHIELGAIDRFAAASLLEETELSTRPDDPKLTRAEIDKIVEGVDRSITAYRRAYSVNPQRATPSWATTDFELFSALVLVGSWETNSQDDRQFVERVTGLPHHEVISKLKPLLLTDDPPFIATAGGWTLTSPTDAALLLMPKLPDAALERWSREAPSVFGPLSSQELLLPAYSGSLQGGVSRAAILLSDSDVPEHQAAATALVRNLLATTEIEVWLALSQSLPNLAEAAPDEFMNTLEVFIHSATDELTTRIAETERTIYGGPWTPFVGLVWALELLCQSPDHCSQACHRLAQFASLDHDWKTGNHPFDSLRRALVPWFPQIALGLKERKALLEGLVNEYPNVAWRLLVSLLPGLSDSTHPLYAPTLRNWHTKRNVSIHENYEGWRDVATVATQMALGDPNRLIRLLESTRYMDADTREGIFMAISILRTDDFLESRTEAWNALREMTAKHRQFPNAQWSLDDGDLARLEAIVESWSPDDVVDRYAYLFSGHPRLPSSAIGTEDYEVLVAATRTDAFKEIMAAEAVTRLDRLIEQAPDAYTVGITLADNSKYVDQSELLPWFELEGAKVTVASTWLIRSFDINDVRWQEDILADLKLLSVPAQVKVFRSLAHHESILDLLDDTTKEVQSGFWATVTAFQLSRVANVEVATTNFLVKRRSAEAIHFLSSRRDMNVTTEQIQRVLASLENSDDTSELMSTMLSFEVGNLLDLLAKKDADETVIAHFEFVFAPLLQYERTPTALFHQLAEGPALFVELVTNAYSDDHDSPENRAELSSEAMALARLSFDVLREWRTLPGSKPDGSIDNSLLSAWVTETRERLAKEVRVRGGDFCIGQLLSGAPTGSDGIWPTEAVRDLIESIESDALREGFEVGKLNARGVTTRGALDGGVQEVVLADGYESDARRVATRWPAVARVLRNLAAHYRESARFEDIRMQRMRDMRA